jgi:hypothetical protein
VVDGAGSRLGGLVPADSFLPPVGRGRAARVRAHSAASCAGHKVRLTGGPTVEAYCAIDALGITAMLNRAVVSSSRDPDTGEPIRIAVTNGEASWRPDETVVLLGAALRAIRVPALPVHYLPQLRLPLRPPAGRLPRR